MSGMVSIYNLGIVVLRACTLTSMGQENLGSFIQSILQSMIWVDQIQGFNHFSKSGWPIDGMLIKFSPAGYFFCPLWYKATTTPFVRKTGKDPYNLSMFKLLEKSMFHVECVKPVTEFCMQFQWKHRASITLGHSLQTFIWLILKGSLWLQTTNAWTCWQQSLCWLLVGVVECPWPPKELLQALLSFHSLEGYFYEDWM